MKRKSSNVKKINPKEILSYLSDVKIEKIYRIFKENIRDIKKKNCYSAAISGGPDSLALAYLIKCYNLETSQKVRYIHVDHDLRVNSAIEAKKTKFLLHKIGINLKILKWKGRKPTSNIQSIARKNRYQIIFNFIKKEKINTLFLGHNLDDLIENFFIRLTRGAGLDGFVSFNAKISENSKNKVIVRPLINVDKSQLLYLTKKIFRSCVNDSSNKNFKFKRVRIRNLIKQFKDEGLDYMKLKKTIFNLSDANSSIKFYVNKNIHNNVTFLSKHKLLLSKFFFDQPPEVVFRSTKAVLKNVSKNYYPPRGKKIINLIQSYKIDNFRKSTLGGCIIEKFSDSVLIYREKVKKSTKQHNLPLV